MTYYGKDLSKYQSADQVTPDFVILNVEDPYIGAKVDRAYADGVRWDVYKWCYPGQSGLAMFNRTKSIVDSLYRDGRYPQFWLDYEDGGVAPWQIDEWFGACRNAGVKPGLYIYLYLMNAQGVTFDGIDGWLAYYPSNGSPYADWFSTTAKARGAKLHQFSSIPVDQNVCLNNAWYEHGTPVTTYPPSQHRSSNAMVIKEIDANHAAVGWWLLTGAGVTRLDHANTSAIAYSMALGGVPVVEMDRFTINVLAENIAKTAASSSGLLDW